MAKKVGTKTGKHTSYGKPVYKTKNGELVSEKSTTLKVDDKWINIPTIHKGFKYTEDEIYDMLLNGEIKPTSIHKSHVEAINEAKERSKNMVMKKKGGLIRRNRLY